MLNGNPVNCPHGFQIGLVVVPFKEACQKGSAIKGQIAKANGNWVQTMSVSPHFYPFP
jgi:hypothetical protein